MGKGQGLVVLLYLANYACGWNWRRFEDSEYLIVYESVSTYAQAENGCATKGGHLADVKTTEIFDFLVQEIDVSILTNWPHDLFIGARKVASNSPFKWTDGSVVDVFQWRDGEPSKTEVNTGASENCIVMGFGPRFDSTFKWNDVPCSGFTHRYICQQSAKARQSKARNDQPKSPTLPEPSNNPPIAAMEPSKNPKVDNWDRFLHHIFTGVSARPFYDDEGTTAAVDNAPDWIRFGNSEYLIVYDVVTSYTQAETGCAAKGDHLANVKTTEIFKFLVGQIDISIVSDRPHDLFIGARKVASKFPFKWTDGSVVDVFQWRDGEPSKTEVNTGASENCIVMGFGPRFDPTFKWNDVPCSGFTHRYICQRSAEDTKGLPKTTAERKTIVHTSAATPTTVATPTESRRKITTAQKRGKTYTRQTIDASTTTAKLPFALITSPVRTSTPGIEPQSQPTEVSRKNRAKQRNMSTETTTTPNVKTNQVQDTTQWATVTCIHSKTATDGTFSGKAVQVSSGVEQTVLIVALVCGTVFLLMVGLVIVGRRKALRPEKETTDKEDNETTRM